MTSTNQIYRILDIFSSNPKAKQMTGKETYTDGEIIKIFKEYMQKKGKFPSKSQIEADKSVPSYTTIKRRFGSYSNLNKF
jgi:hypothetical protein